MSNAMVIYQNFDNLERAAMALQASGYFSDAKTEAQAIVKVMAGAELGLPPFASMTGIHIIQGKPALGANVIATLIKNDPRYDYRVLKLTDTECVIQFFEDGQPCGVSEFTASDANKAGVKNMNRFPRNMLFARAISNGAKWYTPGIFGGTPVYTPDELGADVDEDGGYIDGEVINSGQMTKLNVSDFETARAGHDDFSTEMSVLKQEALHREPEPGTWGDIEQHAATAVNAIAANGKIADLRAALEGVGDTTTLGMVADRAAQTGLYNHPQHAFNAIKSWPGLPDGVTVKYAKKVKVDTALKLFDWMVERKDEEE